MEDEKKKEKKKSFAPFTDEWKKVVEERIENQREKIFTEDGKERKFRWTLLRKAYERKLSGIDFFYDNLKQRINERRKEKHRESSRKYRVNHNIKNDWFEKKKGTEEYKNLMDRIKYSKYINRHDDLFQALSGYYFVSKKDFKTEELRDIYFFMKEIVDNS